MTHADPSRSSYAYDADGRKTAEYDTSGGASEATSDQLAAWTYDTLTKGKLTSSTSFYGGLAYTEQVTGYNTFGLPTGTGTIIPTGARWPAPTPRTWPTTRSGQLAPTTTPPPAGLPAENVTIGYDAAGRARTR